jgi:membrane protein YqaA with SNARE-associated domain
VVEFLIEWGCPGLFIAAFLAGSIVPFSSEVVLVALLEMGVDPVWGVLAATLGNTLGSYSCYMLGYLGKQEWIERYMRVKPERLERTRRFLAGKGALMAFFSFLPAFGELIALALGYMRANRWLTLLAMFVGKLLRYIVIVYIAAEVINTIVNC